MADNKSNNHGLEITEIFQKIADSIMIELKSNMSAYGLNDSNLANSLESNIHATGFQILANNYWNYAQVGRGPGGVPYNFEDILRNWISARNITVQEPEKFVQAVKWKTIREGSYLYRNPNEHRDFIQNSVQDSMEEISGMVAKKVEDTVSEYIIKGII